MQCWKAYVIFNLRISGQIRQFYQIFVKTGISISLDINLIDDSCNC